MFKGLNFATYIEPRENRVVIQSSAVSEIKGRNVGSPGDLPDGAKFVDAPIPPERVGTAPSGAYPPQAGDWIEGGQSYHGWWLNSAGTAYEARRECTFSFGAKWNTVYGVLTAGHCEPSNYGTGYLYLFNGHWIELYGPDYESDGTKTHQKYDFQFHRTPGLKVYNTVGIYNSDGSQTGTVYYVNGTEVRTAQAGSTSCYFGRLSGYSCTSVTDNNYYISENGYTYGPWVRLFISTSARQIQQGDSGGPVMSSPSGGYVKARGIISRGQYYPVQGIADVIYMPIDHIDDVNPIQIITSPSP